MLRQPKRRDATETPRGDHSELGVVNPTLSTARCHLTAPGEADRPGLRLLLIDPEVRRYLGGPVAAAEVETKVAALISGGDGRFWVVRTAADDSFLGLISLDPHHEAGQVEVSYQLLPSCWGQGYGTEIVREVVRYALDELHLESVVAETQAANAASRRVLEKVGMQPERLVMRFGAEQAVYRLSSRSSG